MNIFEKLYKWLEKVIEPLREFIFEHHNNPVFWIVIFVVAILLFWFTYDALRKEK
ncbi:MAG: hypothetical protein PHI05_01545 [Bacilli bacterium]|nr:hypothetical protein [Bacilli bacterium]MDD4547411.1 hypothetical protein [Bacilli bacterium]